MGLDMYYYARTKNKLNVEDDSYHSFGQWDGKDKVDETNYPEDLKELGDYIFERNFKSSFIDEDDGLGYYQIGYFRKFNSLHRYMCELDNGRDECQPIVVNRDTLKELYDLLNEVNHNRSKAEKLLPTMGGFFFGGTEYDGDYFCDVTDAIKMCELFLKYFDFNKYDLIYQASW